MQLTAEQLDRLDCAVATANDQKEAATAIRNYIAGLRAIVQVLDGSQPLDIPGALMIARYWLNDI